MKKSVIVIACLVSLAFLLAVPSASAQADKLIGAWKATEITIGGENGAKSTFPPNHPGLLIFTKKYTGFWNITDVNRPSYPRQGATDAQKVAAWEPFQAIAGTYEVKGNIITRHIFIAKDPNNMPPGNWQTLEFKIEGDTLTTTLKDTEIGPFPNPITMKYVRVE